MHYIDRYKLLGAVEVCISLAFLLMKATSEHKYDFSLFIFLSIQFFFVQSCRLLVKILVVLTSTGRSQLKLQLGQLLTLHYNFQEGHEVAEYWEQVMLWKDACLHALIYYLSVCYVQFSRGAYLPAVPLRSLCQVTPVQ